MKKSLILLIFVQLNIISCENPGFELKNLTQLRLYQLEESDSCIIDNINNLIFNDNYTEFIITETQRKYLIRYSYSSGKIISIASIGLDCIDSIQKYSSFPEQKPPFINFIDGKFLSLKEYIVKINEKKNLELTLEKMDKSLQRSILNTIYINNDTLLLYMLFDIPSQFFKTDINEIKVFVAQFVAFVYFDIKNESYKIILLENKPITVWPTSDLLLKSMDDTKKSFVMSSNNTKAGKRKSYDSLYSISSFDKDGNFIKPLSLIPEEFLKANLIYKFCNPKAFYNSKNELITAYTLLDKVYNTNRNTYFKLKNFDDFNDSFFQKNYNDTNYMKNKLCIHEEISYRLSGIFPIKNGNYLITVSKQDLEAKAKGVKSSENCVFIQEYTPEGELVAQAKMPSVGENGVIQKVHYITERNELVTFQKSSEKGWTVTYWKW